VFELVSVDWQISNMDQALRAEELVCSTAHRDARPGATFRPTVLAA
jgi:hypothetical protein